MPHLRVVFGKVNGESSGVKAVGRLGAIFGLGTESASVAELVRLLMTVASVEGASPESLLASLLILKGVDVDLTGMGGSAAWVSS